MPRPLKQGNAAISHDIVALSRVMRRIEADPLRPEKEKEEMIEHLKAVLTKLLVTGTRTRRPTKAA